MCIRDSSITVITSYACVKLVSSPRQEAINVDRYVFIEIAKIYSLVRANAVSYTHLETSEAVSSMAWVSQVLSSLGNM